MKGIKRVLLLLLSASTLRFATANKSEGTPAEWATATEGIVKDITAEVDFLTKETAKLKDGASVTALLKALGTEKDTVKKAAEKVTEAKKKLDDSKAKDKTAEEKAVVDEGLKVITAYESYLTKLAETRKALSTAEVTDHGNSAKLKYIGYLRCKAVSNGFLTYTVLPLALVAAFILS